jgi:hypothetical protein
MFATAMPRARAAAEVDRVDPDPDLLDQTQPGRPRDDRGGHRPQDVQQHVGLRK